MTISINGISNSYDNINGAGNNTNRMYAGVNTSENRNGAFQNSLSAQAENSVFTQGRMLQAGSNTVDQNSVDGKESTSDSKATDKTGQAGAAECQTCNNRRYQDISNDPGVSFKTPGKINPQVSASVVMSHEQEHVGNERSNAQKDGREVVSQFVKLDSSVCPECGRVYVSGGTTTTVTKTETSDENSYRFENDKNSRNNQDKDFFLTNYNDIVAQNFGMVFDVRV